MDGSESLQSPTTAYRRDKLDGDRSDAKRSPLRFVPVLLRKNWWLKSKRPVALALEILAPVLFIVLIGAVKQATNEYQVPAGFSTDASTFPLFQRHGGDGSAVIAPSFAAKFAVQETTLTGLLLHLSKVSFQFHRGRKATDAAINAACQQQLVYGGRVSLNASSPYALPVECDGRVSPFKIAIVPDAPFTRQYFYETVAKWYPTIAMDIAPGTAVVVPSLADSVVFYASEGELEAYVKSKDYAATASSPRIFGAIVFDQFPAEEKLGAFAPVEYTLRLNDTFLEEYSDKRYVPRTLTADASTWRQFQREIDTLNYQQYAAGGFMTLQTLVTRFVSCMPQWDAASRSTSGACQSSSAVAASSVELDARLLQTVTSDPAVKQFIADMLQDTGGGNRSTIDGEFDLPLTDGQKAALVRPLRQAPQPYLGALTTPFPIAAYTKSTFFETTETVFPLLFLMAYMATLSKILVSLISERETRARELMKILGVTEASIVVSWYATYAAILLLSSIGQAAAARLLLFESSSVVVLFVFFFLFNLTVLAYAFMVSSAVSTSRTGTYVGVLGFFAWQAVSNAFSETSSEASKIMASLLSPAAMTFAVETLTAVETTHVGMSLSSLSSPVNHYRFSYALAMFVVDAVVYTVVGLYLEKVVPKAYGTTETWYFPLRAAYWRGQSQRVATIPSTTTEHEVAVPMDTTAIEPVSADLAEQEANGSALCVQGLRKVFSVPGGEKVAVENLHVTMYSGQITCLLGHNGAGKTTLVSMLTGVLAPTAGDAFFHNKSLRQDVAALRESLGVCFQHDVLYADLTVAEHLALYARIKGFRGDALAAEVDHKMAEMGLVDKRDVAARALSGGTKRKLSVAISLLGDSSLVFLDEPTAGMDPYSRRSTWEALLRNRRDRVLVLTTHFMDEADVLGDRIAIMAEGELRCCGSPLFLKNRYGAGYTLTMVKQDTGCDEARLVAFVLRCVPSGSVLSNVGSEVAFQLPLEASPLFPALFRQLDAQLDTLGLLSYGVSVTTMEEVFIKVAEAADRDHDQQQHTLQQHTLRDKDNAATDAASTDEGSDATTRPTPLPLPLRASTASLFGLHFFALLQKRFRIAKRDKRFGLVSLLLPVAWLVLGLSVLQAGELAQVEPKISLSTDGLAAKAPAGEVLLPAYCQPSSVGDWCAQALDGTTSGARTVPLPADAIPSPPYATDSPTVFNVTYTALDQDAQGYVLKLSELLYDRGYGQSIEGQFGGVLAHADENQRVLSYNVLVNTTVPHAAAMFKGLLDQSVYRLMASEAVPATNVSALSLKVNSHPVPRAFSTSALLSGYMAFTTCFFIAIAMSFYPAPIVVLLVKERHADHNAKHQQLVSGVGLPAFWLANYVWDFVVYLVPASIALLLIQVYDLASLTGSDKCFSCAGESTFTAVVTLFVLFGLAVCPYAYCWSFAFKRADAAQTTMILINLVLGFCLVMASFVMDQIDSTKAFNRVIKWLYRFSPIYSLANGLRDLTVLEIVHSSGDEFDKPRAMDPFAMENAGLEIVFLALTAVLYLAMAIAIDYALTFPTLLATETEYPLLPTEEPLVEDQDVAAERQRVLTDQDVVQLHGLRKVYPGKVAVASLSFGLKRGECFGFLGINGAGKTTTMKMLTGDVAPSGGRATLCGLDIASQQLAVRREIGYCPQFDALIDLLTVREHLELFAMIKGVARRDVDAVVVDKLAQLNLQAFEHKLAGSLSGGNKRKLSVAMALIGSPSILFLDEPSTGMDPVSRRFMWDVIAQICTGDKQATVVLTTHSMDECEALCARVGIMVGGALQCLGSVQHLKHRFGDGLLFDAKLLPPRKDHVRAMAQALDDRVSRDALREACATLGDVSWLDKIAASHATGATIAQALDRDGYVLASALATWWRSEQQYELLAAFLRERFDKAELLERQNDSCWFKIRDDALRLATVFEWIENAKQALAIREYSVSQTSLEQIFNAFASQQSVVEEKVVTKAKASKWCALPWSK